MATSGWKDVFFELPADDTTVWIRSNAGCLKPVQAFKDIGSSEWSIDLPDSSTIVVPFWAYREWHE